MIHNNSFNNTCVQSWSRQVVWVASVLLFSVNVLCFFIGLLVCPQMFDSQEVLGHVCGRQNISFDQVSVEKCMALGQGSIPGILVPHSALEEI